MFKSIDQDGSLLWSKDVAPAFGMAGNKQRIASSPAVADIDADGYPEVVVGTGTIHRSICTQGGMIVLEHDGSVKKGWPFLAVDYTIPPAGCADTVFSTPALGDLDKDGDLEIVFGGFDKRIYAMDHQGKLLPGFPPDSYHFQRFGWGNLRGLLGDTIWSSAALADVDGDSYLDIVIGTDEGNYDSRFIPIVHGWECPYRSPEVQGYCGGLIYALDRHGKLLPGFPQYRLEQIQSTPALFDVDKDGRAEIFIGTGDGYWRNSPDHPQYGFRLFGIDHDGKDLPGWSGGKKVGGVVTTSPAIGDLDGDNIAEVVVTARNKKLYAFHLNGTPVPGFPMTPTMHSGSVLDPYGPGSAIVLADYDGDQAMEIFVRHAHETIIVDGTGKQLTAASRNDSRPAYVTNGTLWNSPAVGDLDGDGHLELVSQNSELTVWSLPNSSPRADWPMLQKNSMRTGSTAAEIKVAPESMLVVHERGKDKEYLQRINVRSYIGAFDWRLSTDKPEIITIPVQSGKVNGETMIDIKVRVKGEISAGRQHLSDVHLKLTLHGTLYDDIVIPLNTIVYDDLYQTYLPYSP